MRALLATIMALTFIAPIACFAQEPAGCTVEGVTFARTVAVSSADELIAALADARPGDLVELADGSYVLDGPLSFTCQATAEQPLVVRAQNRGKAVIEGTAGIIVASSSYVMVDGLTFRHTDDYYAFRFAASHHCRLTRSHINLDEVAVDKPGDHRMHWVDIGGANSHHNRLDHNLIEGKSNSGCMVITGGSREELNWLSSRYDRIDHNHFRDFPRGDGNGFETVRLGVSGYSHSSGFTTVEDNLFEHCDGEGEIVSVKTPDNIIRRNTFRNSWGELTLRNTHRCLVEGNFFFDTEQEKRTAGVRLFGSDHRIINNYFEGLKGAAVIIRTGDVEQRTKARYEYEAENDGKLDMTKYGGYERPERAVVAHNTIVNCGMAMDIGDARERYSLPARDCIIANNLIVSDRERVVRLVTEPENWTWRDNIVHRTLEGAEVGIEVADGGMSFIDPLLQLAEGLWRPGVGSPAIDAGRLLEPPIEMDIEGQPRDGKPDIGADEVSEAPAAYRPLTAADVGPEARE